jgi:hypothetical protein
LKPTYEIGERDKKIAELQGKLADHDWDRAAEITDICKTLLVKLRDCSTREQAEVLAMLGGELGFTDLLKTLIRGRP